MLYSRIISFVQKTDNKRLVVFISFILIVGIVFIKNIIRDNISQLTTQEQKDIISWIRNAAVPIPDKLNDSIFWKNNPAIDSIILRAQIIGLGEATHGTHESTSLNCLMIRYLVENQQCTKIAFESPFASIETLNRYILGDSVLKSDMFYALSQSGSQKSAVFYNLLRWLRIYNQTKVGNKVTLHGIDIFRGDESARAIIEYFRTVDKPFYQKNIRNLRYSAFDLDRMYEQTKEQYIANLQNAQQMNQRLHRKENEYRHISDSLEFERIMEHSQRLLQNMRYPDLRDSSNVLSVIDRSLPNPKKGIIGYSTVVGTQYRDSCMYSNLERIIKSTSSNERIVVWQHNGHIGKIIVDLPFELHVKRLGKYLHDKFGKKYHAIGYAFYQGYAYVGASIQRMDTPPKSSLEFLLHTVIDSNTNKCFSITFCLAPSIVSNTICLKPMLLRNIGSELNALIPQYFESVIGKEFDTIIFFDETSSTKFFRM